MFGPIRVSAILGVIGFGRALWVRWAAWHAHHWVDHDFPTEAWWYGFIILGCLVLVFSPLDRKLLRVNRYRPMFWEFRERRIRRRIAKNQCPRCGYDVRASSLTCPECGGPIRRLPGPST